MVNVLFVCKHNRYRSKIAEAAFKKFNNDKRITSISGGIFKGVPVAKNVIKIGKEYGLEVNRETNCLKEKDLVEADLIVIVAQDVPESLFKPRFKKVITWKINDTSEDNLKEIENGTKQIIKNVKSLIKKLEKLK